MAAVAERGLADMDVDEFMTAGLESDSEEEVDEGTPAQKGKTIKQKAEKQIHKLGPAQKHKQSINKLQDTDPEFYEFLKNEDETLLNFQDSDLSGESSEDELEEEEEEEEEDGGEEETEPADQAGEQKVKQKRAKVKPLIESKYTGEDEADSEEEDFEKEGVDEEGEEDEDRIQVTLAMVDSWDAKMQSGSVGAFKDLVRALTAAVAQIQKKPTASKRMKFTIKGGGTFNTIVRLCLERVYPLLQTYLEVDAETVKKMKLPSSMPKWDKVSVAVKLYLVQLVQLIKGMTDPVLVAALLRHLHKMVPFFACYPPLATKLVKSLVEWWSTAEETVRILSFVCLFSLTRHLKNARLDFILKVGGLHKMVPYFADLTRLVKSLVEWWSTVEETVRILSFFCLYSLTRHLENARLDFILKKMYLSYVRNSRFTSPSTLPVITFMQHSLTEMFALDTRITYQHAFVYIRQLAIHLRNAMTIKKKDSYQSVYNWQYIHCIHLWCRVLGTLHNDVNLKPLIYPLVQTSVGVIKLIPAAKYYPIRFHVVRSLNTLADATGVFIPLLPFLTEAFDITDFNKKHATMSFKPFNFAVILRVSKKHMAERAFGDGVIDQVYDLVLEVCHTHCHTIGFPELVLPTILKMKEFVKTCKVANFTRQIKQLLDKIQENSRHIEAKRSTVTFNITDEPAIRAWEVKVKLEGTPLGTYYKTYRTLREKELRFAETDKLKVARDDENVQTISQKKRREFEASEKAKDKGEDEFQGLFQNDAEDEDSGGEEEDLFVRAERRKQKQQKMKKKHPLGVNVAFLPSDGSEDDGDGDDDEDATEGASEEVVEEVDLESFKQRKTEIFRDGADVKDVVADFEFTSSEGEGDGEDEGEKAKGRKGKPNKGGKGGKMTGMPKRAVDGKRKKAGNKQKKRQKVAE